MSSHSRPTCGIWRKWSITHRLVKPASSAARATAASVAAVVGRVPGAVEARDLQAELERHRILLLARGRVRARSRNAGGTSVDRPGGVDAGEALAGERARRRRGRLAQLRGDDLGRHGVAARAVARAHDRRPAVEHDGVGRHAVALAPASRHAARRLALEPGRVDHGGQPARAAAWPRSGRAPRTRRGSRAGRARRAPTTARSRSDETTWSGCEPLRAPSATCPPPVAPTSTTRHGIRQAQRHS